MRIKGGSEVLVFIIALVDLIDGKERVWKFDVDISNPANWVDGKLAEGCQGVHFAPLNDAPVYIRQLAAQELVLPSDGEIDIIDGGSIEFKDNKKCIKLKPLNYHDWYDEDSWEKSENVAVPHKERIPCDHDDVVFPKGIHTRVSQDLAPLIETRSIKLGDDLPSNEEMETFMDSEMGSTIFFNPIAPFSFDIKRRACDDPFGCFCHSSYVPCPTKKSPGKTTCLNPIEPEDFCREICGAYVTFKPKTGFRLDHLRSKLSKYAVDTYASRVKDYLGNDVIQVVFSEKEYEGKSLEEAQDFLDGLKTTDDVENAQMQKSGRFVAEGGGVGSTLAIVFGTFVAVGMFFAVFLYLNGDTRVDLIIS
ncbi:uncharacterized protein BDFB_012663, partial [Asbolus verrucosus]